MATFLNQRPPRVTIELVPLIHLVEKGRSVLRHRDGLHWTERRLRLNFEQRLHILRLETILHT